MQGKPIVKVVSTSFPLGLGITYLNALYTPRLNGGRGLLSSDTNKENPTRAIFKAPFESLFVVVERVDSLFGHSGLTQVTAPLIFFFFLLAVRIICFVLTLKHELQVIVVFYSSTTKVASFSTVFKGSMIGLTDLLL